MVSHFFYSYHFLKLFYAKVLAEELMHLHGLDDWHFCFDHAKKRFGCCHYIKKQISLSADLVALNSEEQVRETILHEIAHALAGHLAGHGKLWKEAVIKIGGTPSRCYDAQEVCTPKMAFTGICPSCALTLQRRKKARLLCAKCRVGIEWKKN